MVPESMSASVKSKNSEATIPFEVPAKSKSIGIQPISGLYSVAAIGDPSARWIPEEVQHKISIS